MKSIGKGRAGVVVALCSGALGLAACGSAAAAKTEPSTTTVVPTTTVAPASTLAPTTTVAPSTTTTIKAISSGGVSY